MAHSDPTPPPPPPDLAEIAPLFPELEILELLGQGGMGSVYKARQRALGRLVALKILAPRSGDEAAFAGRFEREAHALARLAHPNVVGIHDSGRTQGRCWLLMEYVEGVNLRQLLRTGELDVPRALAIVRQVCDALEFAHGEGIVHRDIKPENVLVDSKGRVKIADFGLAKIVGEEASGEPITRTQQSMGTPQYMAPEQLTGSKSVDHRADIYSLGVVFYELLTGEVPLGRFEAPSERVQIDVRLDEVVLRALERAPERRYQHATEMKTRIDGLGQPAQAAAAVPSLAWLILFWPAELIFRLVPQALGLGPQHEQQLLLAFNGLVALVLFSCAFVFRADRRGAALRTALGATLVVGAIVTLARESVVFPSLFGLMQAAETPLEMWFVRGLLGLIAFEGLRLVLSGRAALRALGAGAVVLGAMFEGTWAWVGLVQCLAVLAVDPPAATPPEKRDARLRPPRPLRTLVGRIVLPVLVAISAWVMPLYTSGWGWFGVVASSLVLALAVAGYLQQSLPDELREELRASPGALRVLRSFAAFVLLSIGAIGLGAAMRAETPRPVQEETLLLNERVQELARLVASNASEAVDPLTRLPERAQRSRMESATLGAVDRPQEPERRPSGPDGMMLVLVAPALLVWTRRWGASWTGCWRYSIEVLAVVLLGLAGSLPVNRVLIAAKAPLETRPLVLEASLPLGLDRSRERLEHELEACGYHVQRRVLRTYGDAEGPVMRVETLRVRRAAGPAEQLEIDVAGDSNNWASAVRIDAGSPSADAREECRELLKSLLQRTRGN